MFFVPTVYNNFKVAIAPEEIGAYCHKLQLNSMRGWNELLICYGLDDWRHQRKIRGWYCAGHISSTADWWYCKEISYFVPVSEKGEELAQTFILEGVGHDIWCVPWERLEKYVGLEEYKITCLADSEVLYAWSIKKIVQHLSVAQFFFVQISRINKSFQYSDSGHTHCWYTLNVYILKSNNIPWQTRYIEVCYMSRRWSCML